MSNRLNIAGYLPEVGEIEDKFLRQCYDKIARYIKNQIPELDVSPNTVIGDLFIRPAAVYMAAMDVAMETLFADLDLNNIINGGVTNERFVRNFLETLGAKANPESIVSGIVTLIFEEDKEYVINRNTVINFGNQSVGIILNNPGNLIIKPTRTFIQNNPTENIVKLRRAEGTLFLADIPVFGESSVNINVNQQGRLSQFLDGIISVSAPFGIKSVSSLDSLQKMAEYVTKTIYAVSFGSRGGIRSFITNRFPDVSGCFPCVSGDQEMLRDTTKNIFGFSTGSVDIYVKPNNIPVIAEKIIDLYSFNNQGDNTSWAGFLSDDGSVLAVTEVLDFETGDLIPQTDYKIYGISKNNIKLPAASSSFSDQERLGISIKNINIENYSGIQTITGNGLILDSGRTLSFSYQEKTNVEENFALATPSLFSTFHQRNIKLKFKEIKNIQGKQYIRAEAYDNLTGITVNNIIFDIKRTSLILNKILSENNTISLFLGFTIVYNFTGSSQIQTSELNNLLDREFTISINLNNRSFIVRYLTDPLLHSVAEVIKDNNNAPVYDVHVRYPNFIIIDNFFVSYTKSQWAKINEEKIKDEIFEYVNSVFYPRQLNQSIILDILTKNGADTLHKMSINGKLYLSPANFYSVLGNEGSFYATCGPYSVKEEFKDVILKDLNISATRRNTCIILFRDKIELSEEI